MSVGYFFGSQLNWAALMKGSIWYLHVHVKKSTFYLTGHEITLRSDHLPLKKFLRKMTFNQMVNNWSTELECFTINCVHISWKDNVLADTLSQLIDMDPDLKQQPELEGYEFGKFCFETLPKVRGSSHHKKSWWWWIWCVWNTNHIQQPHENLELSVELPLEDEKNSFLCRSRSLKIQEHCDKVKKGMYHEFYLIKHNVLFRSIVDDGHKFEARVIPDSLVDVVLHLGHNQTRHNGYQRHICSNQAFVLLERYEGANFAILQKQQGLCTTKG